MMLSARAVRTWQPAWERCLKLDPLFAGCLPSKPLALIASGARQMAQKTTPCRRVCCARAHETEPSKYDLVVLLALNPIRCTRASSYQALRGQNMVACPGLPSLSWTATRRTQPRRVDIRLRSLSCRTCRPPWVTAARGRQPPDDCLQVSVTARRLLSN